MAGVVNTFLTKNGKIYLKIMCHNQMWKNIPNGKAVPNLSYFCDMDLEMLGKRVLLSRRDLGMKQEEVGDIVGISGAYVSRIEHGKADGVTLDVVNRLAVALGVSPAYLMGYTGNPLDGVGDTEEESSNLSPEEEELIELVRGMTLEQRRQMLWGAPDFG